MRYLSQCPKCELTYQLSLMQLNISQGKVRCVQCNHAFDAYASFILDPEYVAPPVSNFLTEILSESSLKYEDVSIPAHLTVRTAELSYVDTIMAQSIDGSRLNLYTYLNHLDTLSPIHSQTRKQNCQKDHKSNEESLLFQQERIQIQRNKFAYYLVWGSINLLLILLFAFQVILFNFK